MKNVYDITAEFERRVAEYCGAPYCIAVDNASNALYMALKYEKIKGKEISIPNRTYVSVPNEIINAGGKVKFETVEGKTIKGAYQLKPTKVWDSALAFSADMYKPGTFMCVSFTGPYKHLKLSKAGAILLDDEYAYMHFKKARYSGRRECSYHEDHFDMIGNNFYLMPEISARGILLITQFYDSKGNKKINEDLELPYPDLSQFPIFTNSNQDLEYSKKEIKEKYQEFLKLKNNLNPFQSFDEWLDKNM